MRVFSLSLLLLTLGIVPLSAHAQKPASLDETIVLIRHAEKPFPPLGQLSCKGLDRALVLPSVLAKFGRPAAIFAPSPADEIKDGNDAPNAPTYSYLRPLTTIEPYAISLHMPVDAEIGYNQIFQLQTALLQPQYAHAYVLVVWEHLQAVRFARQLLSTFGDDPSAIPPWPATDYDTIYVFHLTSDANGKRHLSFRSDSEGLTGRLPDTCPTVQLLPQSKTNDSFKAQHPIGAPRSTIHWASPDTPHAAS